MAKEKLFGTDGIRGEAYLYPLLEEFVEKIGFSAGKILGREKGNVLVGYDTRESSEVIKKWLFEGFTKSGIDAYDCGVFPTPAVSAMVREKNFDFRLRGPGSAPFRQGVSHSRYAGRQAGDLDSLLWRRDARGDSRLYGHYRR